MNIRPIKNHVLFKFIDKVNSKGQFEPEATKSGIILSASFDDSAKVPRWAEVLAIGPNCKKVKVGQQILLPALRWTTAVKFEGQNIWKTDEDQVVATRTSTAKRLNVLNNYIIFARDKKVKIQSSGLIVVGTVDTTETGTVVTLDAKCERKLFNAKIYFSTDNFFENFEHDNKKYSFIKEEGVLAYVPVEE